MLFRQLQILVAALVLAAAPLAAQAADSAVARPEPFFSRRDAIAAGAVVLGAAALFAVDDAIAEALQDSARQANEFYEQSAATLGYIQETNLFLASAGVYAIGRIADAPQLADIGLHTGEAILLTWGVGGLLKQVIGRARPRVPDSDASDFQLGKGNSDPAYRAFPSLHAGGSFAAAAALVSETRHRWPRATRYVAPIAFGAAGLVGLGRMYEDQHWASDVLVGAAMGTFAGFKVVRYNHAHPSNRLDRWLLHTQWVPEGPSGTVRIGVSRSF